MAAQVGGDDMMVVALKNRPELASHQALVSRGVAFVGEPHVIHRTPQYDLWMAFFKDSEGNPLALMCEQQKA